MRMSLVKAIYTEVGVHSSKWVEHMGGSYGWVKGRIFIISLGGCGQIMGGVIFFPDNGLTRRRFAPPHSHELFIKISSKSTF